MLGHLLPEPHAGLLAGMLLGTRNTMAPEFHDALVATGTLHIIALSGFNISILINIIGLTLSKFVSKSISSVASIVIIIGFILFVGPSPSIVRAGFMGSLSLIAVLLGRQRWALYSLFLTSVGMVIVRFEWLWDISFQLSVMSSLGLILLASGSTTGAKHMTPDEDALDAGDQVSVASDVLHVIQRIVRDIWNALYEDLRLTLAAQAFTFPLILIYFGRVSLVSPLSNMLIGWVIAPITLIGIVVVILGLIWLPLAIIPSWIVWVLLEYLVRIVMFTSRFPYASIEVTP